MELESWEKIVNIATLVWFAFFIIKFLSYDYTLFCVLGLLCFDEPLIEVSGFTDEVFERITMIILGFFVFDLGFKCGKSGNWINFLKNRENIMDILLTIPFFWIFEPHEIIRTLRLLKVLKVILNVYRAYKKSKRFRNNV